MRPVRYTLMEHISAPIDQVFAALIDPRCLERWLPGCAGVAVEGPIRKSTRLKVQFGRRFTELDVVDFAPPRTFGWVERGQRKDYKTFFQLDPTGGATRLPSRKSGRRRLFAPGYEAASSPSAMYSATRKRSCGICAKSLRRSVGSRACAIAVSAGGAA
jgi:uncharacterized protein YndB with AHSA1/START domain